MERNVLTTGSASGLGREAARLFAERGYRVFAGVRRTEDAGKVARLHPAITPVLLDVADPAGVAAAADQVDRACGPAGLAVLVNAAGSILYGPIEHTTRAEAAALFEVLTFGPFELSNRMLPALKRFATRGEGRAKVLNVISWASLDANPFVGFYAAAKAGAPVRIRWQPRPRKSRAKYSPSPRSVAPITSTISGSTRRWFAS